MSFGYRRPLNIGYFDPSTMKKNGITFIVGRRGSGKSTVAEYIMSFHTDIKEGICLSKTDKMNGFWSNHVPQLFIHHEYSPDITYSLLQHQEDKWKRYKKKCKKEGKEAKLEDITPVFAIYDDVTYDKTFLKDKATRELFMNGRHYNIFVMITCQYLMDIGPDLRGQIDYVITLKDNTKSNREKMYLYFGGPFNDFWSFNRVYIDCTANREALVIYSSGDSYDISDTVFFFRAVPNLEYRLGSEEYWSYAKEKYIGDDEDDEEDDKMGMTRREKEKMDTIEVTKHYPGEDGDNDNDNDSDDDDGYKRVRKGDYASMYRDNTLPPKLLANRKRKKRDDIPNEIPMVIPPSARLGNGSTPGSNLGPGPAYHEEDKRDRDRYRNHGEIRRDRFHDHLRKRYSSSSTPQPVLKSRSTGKVRKELKTEIETPFAPPEVFGEEYLAQIRHEKIYGTPRPVPISKKKKKDKDKKEKKKKKKKRDRLRELREEEERQEKLRRRAMEDQLFLY